MALLHARRAMNFMTFLGNKILGMLGKFGITKILRKGTMCSIEPASTLNKWVLTREIDVIIFSCVHPILIQWLRTMRLLGCKHNVCANCNG